MSEMIIVILVLIGIIAFQQVSIHKLVNKLMSQNFHEYKSAVNLVKEEKKTFIPDINEIPEDLRNLQELQPF